MVQVRRWTEEEQERGRGWSWGGEGNGILDMEIGVWSKGSTVITKKLIYIYNYMPVPVLV